MRRYVFQNSFHHGSITALQLSSFPAMPIVDGVVPVMPVPFGYPQVNFDNPTRDWPVIRQIYWIYGFATAIALFFLLQNLCVKVYINRRLEGETGEWSSFRSK
jgi:hypothetical protein